VLFTVSPSRRASRSFLSVGCSVFSSDIAKPSVVCG
jgi:hypothetical protein